MSDHDNEREALAHPLCPKRDVMWKSCFVSGWQARAAAVKPVQDDELRKFAETMLEVTSKYSMLHASAVRLGAELALGLEPTKVPHFAQPEPTISVNMFGSTELLEELRAVAAVKLPCEHIWRGSPTTPLICKKCGIKRRVRPTGNTEEVQNLKDILNVAHTELYADNKDGKRDYILDMIDPVLKGHKPWVASTANTDEHASYCATRHNWPMCTCKIPQASSAGNTEERDWDEDRGHENGRYQNDCHKCGKMFIGHKRRMTCRLCASPSSPLSEEKAVEVMAEAYTDHNLKCGVPLGHKYSIQAAYRALKEAENAK